MKAAALSSFRLSPAARVKLNRFRLAFDVIGVFLVRFISPLVHLQAAATLLSIYNMAAWVTILTVDPTRVPEFTTTRTAQKRAWRFTLKLLPLIAIGLALLTLLFHIPFLAQPVTVGSLVPIVIGSYMDELLFRNILQPKLRQWGVSKWGAVLIQSLLYAICIWSYDPRAGVVISCWFLGIFHGWIVYRHRSLWPVFTISFIWKMLIWA